MPVPARSIASSTDADTYSLLSQATTTMTIGDSLPAQLVRKSARKGFTFNTMSIGPPGVGKTAILSALFGKYLEFTKDKKNNDAGDSLNPPIMLDSKTFEIDDKKVRLKLTVVECKDYGQALKLDKIHIPLVEYIDMQFADYHKRESSFDRRNIQDKMIHCLFFFVSAIGPGPSRLDLEFLNAVHKRVNIIPVIANAEALTLSERSAFKRRVKDSLEKNHIQIYQMPDPDPDDSDDIKRSIKDIQEAIPFAVTSMVLKSDCSLSETSLGWADIDPYNMEHCDFALLKRMLHMQMPDLCDSTHEVFYEDYRVRMMSNKAH